MKRLFSTLVASAMAVSVMTAVSASALNVNEKNALSISTEVLSESVTTTDGSIIPAGIVAITVNIENNNGFKASTTKIELGEAYDVVNNSVDMAAITIGTVMGDSHVCAIENNNIIVVSSASASNNTNDGVMFTFYAVENNNSTDKNIEFIDADGTENASVYATRYRYYIGDVNQDNVINAVDSSDVLTAISRNNGKELSVSTANSNLSYYLPNALKAESADTDKTGTIAQADADDILLYYSCTQTGKDYEEYSDYYCGELVVYVE